MTVRELVSLIEARGGNLTLRNGKICCDVPDDAADLIEVVRVQRDAVIEVLRQREARQFVCEKCGVRFDTSVGRAWHEANDCADVPRQQARTTTLSTCPACGSYALCPLQDGGLVCQTCGGAA